MKFLFSWWFILSIILLQANGTLKRHTHTYILNIIDLLRHLYSHDYVCVSIFGAAVSNIPFPNQSIGVVIHNLVYKPELHREVISFCGERSICQHLFWSTHRNNNTRKHCSRSSQFQTWTLENNCSQITSSHCEKGYHHVFRGTHRSIERRYLTLN